MRSEFLQVFRHFLRFRKEQWLDEDTLEVLKKQRLEKILDSAKSTKFYARLLADYDVSDVIEDISILPATSKKTYQDSNDDFIRPRIKDLPHYNVSTSGSTGIPLQITLDQDAVNHRTAALGFIQTEFGRTPLDSMAELSVVPCSTLPFLHKLGLFRKLDLLVFDDEEVNYEKLSKYKPDILGWYPSPISILSKLNDSSGKPLKLKSVYTGAEMLSPECKRSIENSFSCPVYQQYGAVEFGTIAFECPEEHNFHICPTCELEILDKNDKPKKSGEGEIAITSLVNHAMPFIRYKIGDLGSHGKPCSCGRGLPVLKSLGGRSNDIITLPSGKSRSAVSFDIFYGIAGLLKYQVIQEREDLFVFRYVSSDKDLPASSKEIVKNKLLSACLGESISMEFEKVDNIKKSKSGKISTVISKIKQR
ncbi:AMP-binding protein [Candidatus Micrarchaeota archaeon]|nr:AMP-binding protein [Candidatus Micrarchaeota archaeon]MBU1681462.1 AMP-binding protein [Candidatus Micrarchaeota archaeon]